MNSNDSKSSDKGLKDRTYTLQSFLSKINKIDMNKYGNYFVDFNEVFSDTNECVG